MIAGVANPFLHSRSSPLLRAGRATNQSTGKAPRKLVEPLLLVNGKSFSGWTGVSISRSMRQGCGSFSLDFAPNTRGSKSQIREQDACKVMLGNTLVNTGYVESLTRQIDEGTFQPSVSGRDKTCDLVDCCHVGSKSEWLNTKLEKIVADLCRPYGITVVTEVSTGAPIKKFKNEPGSKVMDMIMQLASYRAIIVMTPGDGKLYLTTVKGTQCHDRLFFGPASNPRSAHNVVSSAFSSKIDQRFSSYTVQSQVQSDNDSLDGTQVPVSIKATVTDSAVTRYRPLVIVAEEGLSFSECQRQALWEKSTRAGAALEYPCTVLGWTQSNGALWNINTRALLEDTVNGIKDWMQIVDVEYTISEEGYVTNMVLVPPAALKQLAVKEPVEKPDTTGVEYNEPGGAA